MRTMSFLAKVGNVNYVGRTEAEVINKMIKNFREMDSVKTRYKDGSRRIFVYSLVSSIDIKDANKNYPLEEEDLKMTKRR